MPGKSHGQKSLAGYSPWGRKRVGHNLATKQQQILFLINTNSYYISEDSNSWTCYVLNLLLMFHRFAFPQMLIGASLVAQTVKNLPAMQETWVLSLNRKDALAKGTATHSSVLA